MLLGKRANFVEFFQKFNSLELYKHPSKEQLVVSDNIQLLTTRLEFG